MQLSSVMHPTGCTYLIMKSAIYEAKDRLLGKQNSGISPGVTQ
jgi:hypothetical protein